MFPDTPRDLLALVIISFILTLILYVIICFSFESIVYLLGNWFDIFGFIGIIACILFMILMFILLFIDIILITGSDTRNKYNIIGLIFILLSIFLFLNSQIHFTDLGAFNHELGVIFSILFIILGFICTLLLVPPNEEVKQENSIKKEKDSIEIPKYRYEKNTKK